MSTTLLDPFLVFTTDRTCAVCHHPVVKLGNQWACTERCHCLMLGCVLDEGRPPVPGLPGARTGEVAPARVLPLVSDGDHV